jgi:hypothetical protein
MGDAELDEALGPRVEVGPSGHPEGEVVGTGAGGVGRLAPVGVVLLHTEDHPGGAVQHDDLVVPLLGQPFERLEREQVGVEPAVVSRSRTDSDVRRGVTAILQRPVIPGGFPGARQYRSRAGSCCSRSMGRQRSASRPSAAHEGLAIMNSTPRTFVGATNVQVRA